jgi:2-polyprenyl-3-methyl-5-hydroxy-6-metoxy-1,4-benzoquinol methylase
LNEVRHIGPQAPPDVEVSGIRPQWRDNHAPDRPEFVWSHEGHAQHHAPVIPALRKILGPGAQRSLLDLGCGNGALTATLAADGFNAVGVDVSTSGVAVARSAHSSLDFREHDLELPLPADLHGRFDVAVSAEVIEHLFLPRALFRRADEALQVGGRLVVTTPYHGWIKNLALALTNSFDKHWHPGSDYGRVKFFSIATLTDMAHECGFKVDAMHRVGRVPPLAMSMIMLATKVQ